MFPGHSHAIEIEHDPAAPRLRQLAALDEAPALRTPALVAHRHGEPVAALSLVDDRAVADPFHRTDAIVTVLRLRATGLRAVERQPSLRERITAQLRLSGVAAAA